MLYFEELDGFRGLYVPLVSAALGSAKWQLGKLLHNIPRAVKPAGHGTLSFCCLHG